MRINAEQLEQIAAKLKAMPDARHARQGYTRAEAVEVLKVEITALQKRGYTIEQIAGMLRGEGLDIATPTLRAYLQRVRSRDTKRQHQRRVEQQQKQQQQQPKAPAATISKPCVEQQQKQQQQQPKAPAATILKPHVDADDILKKLRPEARTINRTELTNREAKP
jgi:ribosomal protein L22